MRSYKHVQIDPEIKRINQIDSSDSKTLSEQVFFMLIIISTIIISKKYRETAPAMYL